MGDFEDAVLAALERLQRGLDDLREQRHEAALTPALRALAGALPAVFQPDEVFTTGHLVDLASRHLSLPDRKVLARALDAFDKDPRRIGIALRRLSEAGAVCAGLRLVALPVEEGARRWTLSRTRSL